MTISVMPNIFGEHCLDVLSHSLFDLRPELIIDRGQLSHLVCIGQQFYVTGGSLTLLLEAIFVSKASHLVFVLSSKPQTSNPSTVIECLGSLSLELLNNIASAYSYGIYGQSYLIRDIMVRHGQWTYSIADVQEQKIEACLNARTFSVMCIDK